MNTTGSTASGQRDGQQDAQHIRRPVVAGRFYPDSPAELQSMLRAYLDEAAAPPQKPTLLAMVPHAGYVFSGAVAGCTLAQAMLPQTLFVLGPNHTGKGSGIAVWPEGVWRTPLGDVPVDNALAAEFCALCAPARPDTLAHSTEHSLEVVLPFLQFRVPRVRIVPVSIGDPSLAVLTAAGAAMAQIIRRAAQTAAPGGQNRIAMVVSSDMTHFLPQDEARRLDAMALEQVTALNPQGLYTTVREKRISMCGVLPMTAALEACRLLGATGARLTRYATSGDITGKTDSVVGYAGALVDVP